ncbi:glycoside hydrolase family 3 protein [Cohnella ginsengisoli]|uniref:Glycoside hydrolase family 3 protein n=1 Tax=Cohnella ginsengisoli TaxID=425004 RepID=A0A9X4KJ36_9BACL|nr:glycoside hydrolase family 3 protein [Cohnella ginsengisoli]MDG0792895.1 glycoside hydrolase family 3 protein [Cohnella ginsengisoli]
MASVEATYRRPQSLREKIGQLIVTGFPGASVTEELKALVRDWKIGNIILFSHNAENKSQLARLCGDLQGLIGTETGYPALISIDQEGGRVTRLPRDAVNVPGAMAIAAAGDPSGALTAGRITAAELRALGINFNLAPVLDINNNKRNPVINVRSYGDTAETVAKYGLQMLRGLQEGGVLAALKHFPGHGDTEVDSHLGLPSSGKTLAELEVLELLPFRAAIAAGAEAIMIAHMMFPAIEPRRVPATMSSVIVEDLLKGKLGYEGLVVSDCLEMDAVKKYYGTAQGALGALKAGIHLLFVSHTPSLVRETVLAIEQAVQSGELPMETVDRAVDKVLYYKEKYASGSEASPLSVVGCEAHRKEAAAISDASICVVSGGLDPLLPGETRTLFVGSLPYRTDQASSQVAGGLSFPDVMADRLGGGRMLVGIDPVEAEIDSVLREAERYDRVVYGLFNGIDNPGQLEVVRRLVAAGKRVTAVALGKPYDLEALEGVDCGLAAFEYTALSLESVARVLSEKVRPAGRIGNVWHR